ncbi:MAG: hypothetical protein AAFP28_11755 [Pseudomonadota bacterium]
MTHQRAYALITHGILAVLAGSLLFYAIAAFIQPNHLLGGVLRRAVAETEPWVFLLGPLALIFGAYLRHWWYWALLIVLWATPIPFYFLGSLVPFSRMPDWIYTALPLLPLAAPALLFVHLRGLGATYTRTGTLAFLAAVAVVVLVQTQAKPGLMRPIELAQQATPQIVQVQFTPDNPLRTPAFIVPETQYLVPYAILRAVPSKSGGVIAMGLSIALLAALPWLDRGPPQPFWKRRGARWLVPSLMATFCALTILGATPFEPPFGGASRVFTGLYFLILLSFPIFTRPR